jgi:4-amino-4-deoxy-L-arabinose transferase-like glycosyltransferase
LAAITAIAAAVRFVTLGAQSLDHDETVTAVRVLQPTFTATMSAVAHSERTPPLYYILEWLWTKPLGFGTGIVSLRSLSAIFGTLTVPAVYLAARELSSRRAGVAAAALVALNPFLVWYSQEARAYALLALFIALGVYVFARALREPTARRLWPWALVSVLALCSHYFAVFTIAPEAVWLLIVIRPRWRALVPAAAVAAAGAALLPLAMTQQGSGQSDFLGDSLFTRVWQTPVHFATTVKPDIPSTLPWLTAVQIAIAVAVTVFCCLSAVILARRGLPTERRGAAVAAVLAAASLMIPIALASAGTDFVDARNLVGSLVLVLIAVGIVLGGVRLGTPGTLTLVGVCASFVALLALSNVTAEMQRPDDRVNAVIAPTGVRRIVIFPRPAESAVAYYLRGSRGPSQGRPVRAQEIDLYSKTKTTDPPKAPFTLASERKVPAPVGSLCPGACDSLDRMWFARYVSPRLATVPTSPHRLTKMIGQSGTAILSVPAGAR